MRVILKQYLKFVNYTIMPTMPTKQLCQVYQLCQLCQLCNYAKYTNYAKYAISDKTLPILSYSILTDYYPPLEKFIRFIYFFIFFFK